MEFFSFSRNVHLSDTCGTCTQCTLASTSRKNEQGLGNGQEYKNMMQRLASPVDWQIGKHSYPPGAPSSCSLFAT